MLCNPMDCSLPGSSVHGIFQAIVLEWLAISFSRGSSQPRDQTRVSCTVDRHFTVWATREVLRIHKNILTFSQFSSVSRARLFATPLTAGRQALLSITNSQSLLKLMSIELVMPSNYLILCLLQPIFSLFLQRVVEDVWFFYWQENISVHNILPDRFSIFFISDTGISVQLSSILLWREKQQTGREIAYRQK